VTSDTRLETRAFHPHLSTLYALSIGLAGLGFLGYRGYLGLPGCCSADSWAGLIWPPIVLFAALSFLVQRSSFHLGTPTLHSLAGVIDLAAVLALGPEGGAVVAAISGLAYLELNALRHGRLTRQALVELPLFNAGLKALLALAAGSLFQTLLGSLRAVEEPVFPVSALTGPVVLSTGVLCLLWFLLDHIGWGILDMLDGGPQRLRQFLLDAMPQALLTELLPLPFSLTLVLAYAHPYRIAFVLLALATVAAALFVQRWADVRRELTQRVAELTTIENVGRTIAQAELDVDELCRLLYEQASRVVDTTIFHLGLFSGDDYSIKLWMREGQEEPQQTFRLMPGIGLVSWLRDSKQPILVEDFDREMDSLPAKPVYMSDHPPNSALFVPLLAGETVIGTVSAQSYRRRAYGDADLRVLSAMANQAAVAIQKAQLYAQERRRRLQLETIGYVSRKVAATLDLEELFKQTVHLVRDSFGYYHVALYSADPERQTVTFQQSASAGDQDVVFDVEWGQGLIGWVAANGQPVTVNDVENDTRYRCIEALDETQSELAVPLCLETELVGVLDVQSDQLQAFGPDDLFILETLGDQIAIAIQEARLYEAERQQAWFSTALLQVAEASSRMSSMDDVLATIVRLTPILAGVDRCAILLWEPEIETFRPTQTHGLTAELRKAFEAMTFPLGAVPALDAIRWDMQPLLVNTSQDGSLIPQSMVQAFDIREMVLLPLLARGDLLGAMMVDYAGRSHPFTERGIDMLSGIANQAALVIQSARLLQGQQEEAYVSMALLQVAEAVSRSPDMNTALAAVTRITPMLVGVESCAMFLRDPETAAFVPYQQYGMKKEAQAAFWHLSIPETEPLAGALVHREPWDAVQEALNRSPAVQVLGRGSLLALPLVGRDEVLGMMTVDHSSPAPQISLRWRSILSGIADQAAIAVENDRLRKEAAEQERMKQELVVAHRIQSSFLPDRCPDVPGWEIAAIWRSAREVGGDFYDFFPLPRGVNQGLDDTGPMGVVIADVADKGVPAALFMALSRTLMRTVALGGKSPGVVVAQVNNLILADARSELFVTLFYLIVEPNSGEITFVNAGHMPPLLITAADGSIQELRTQGMAMGVLPDIGFEERRAYLNPGDAIILYTDGVTDAWDDEQQMFGRSRLAEVARSQRHLPAAELARAIDSTVSTFVGGAAAFDDVTLLVVRRNA
jgi:serine phosphatase RsbU (regulator of sigma subunit)/putative methionine-R-sulfoxide reductase with GAF domain